MWNRYRWLFVVTLSLGSLLGCQNDLNLSTLEREIAQDHDITQLPITELRQTLLNQPDTVALFDVRQSAEYAVSHIEGAIRVAPSISAEQFLQDHGATIVGKRVVFYCSVGVRSSQLADRLQTQLTERGLQVYNLRGGAFRWHNARFPMVNDSGQVGIIHPFNEHWGQLLERRHLIAYQPRSLRNESSR